MKTKLLFLVLLIVSSIYAAPKKEIAELKKKLNIEKRNVTKLSNKRNNLVTSYQVMAKDYVAAKANQDSLSHNPNSLVYKNAVKQTEKYGKKKDELLNSIEVLQQQIDSVNALITNYKATLLKLQNEQALEAEKKRTPKEQQRNNESTQKTNTEQEKDVEDIPIEKDKKSNAIIQSTESEIDNQYVSSEITHPNQDKEKPKNVPDWQNWLYTIGIGLLGVILFYYGLKKNFRCPRCGRWFSYDEIGRTTAGKKGTRYIHHIKYKCRNCGYHHTQTDNANA